MNTVRSISIPEEIAAAVELYAKEHELSFSSATAIILAKGLGREAPASARKFRKRDVVNDAKLSMLARGLALKPLPTTLQEFYDDPHRPRHQYDVYLLDGAVWPCGIPVSDDHRLVLKMMRKDSATD